MAKKYLTDAELQAILEESDFFDSDDSLYDQNYEISEHDQSDSDSVANDDCERENGQNKKRKCDSEPGTSKKYKTCTGSCNNDEIVSEGLESSYDEYNDSSSDSKLENNFSRNTPNTQVIWHETDSTKLNKFIFNPGPVDDMQTHLATLTGAADFYFLFVNEDVIDLLVTETNKYYDQKLIEGIVEEKITPNSLIAKWNPLSVEELKRFLGLIIWMGLDKKPTLRDYWSTHVCYKNDIAAQCGISRNRFEAILHFLHVADNESHDNDDKLYKIHPLVQLMNKNFQKWCIPQENVCIDETMIPFRGRLGFRQYIPGKKHKYGLKLFKLCMEGGYTYGVKVYGGKSIRPENFSVATDVVMQLMYPLLNNGLTLVTDNFYTSVTLAHKLNAANTHLIGTLRRNRKFNATAVTSSKLRRGEMKVLQSNTKVIVGKWRDKREVLFLTTKSVPEMQDVATRKGINKKPSTILEYNSIKSFIDVSDQKAAYASTIRKGLFSIKSSVGIKQSFVLFSRG